MQTQYLNRELSWLGFNERVLEEACDRTLPPLERLKFLGITASNLDEFFMVRVAGLHQQIEEGDDRPDFAGMTPKQQLEKVSAATHTFMRRQYTQLARSILPALEKRDIRRVLPSELTELQQEVVSGLFETTIFPALTPLAVDSSRPFPLLANRSLNLAVRIRDGGDIKYAVVQVPSILSRVSSLPCQRGIQYILLEDIISHHLQALFPGHDILSSAAFRITRDADLEIDEDTDDLLEEVEKSVKLRKRGDPVRLEANSSMDKETLAFLMDALDVGKNETYTISGPLDLNHLSKFAFSPGLQRLCREPVQPVPPQDFAGVTDYFAAIREADRLVHVPFESFDCVVNFVRQAAADENVLAIKQTLYRVSGNSPIIAALIAAAENGKQVTAVVELRARFDEENNIQWAKRLERAGCHVIYGLYGLKIHCKMLLVVRREEDGIRRYVHMGTGNYNDTTARLYTDMGLFTARDAFGADASSLFNVLTGYSTHSQYKKIVTSPNDMFPFIQKMLEMEMENVAKGVDAEVFIKVNSLSDQPVIDALYRASCAGVRIKLLVRGICCLLPGVPGLSENITVHSIVGRLLEHTRIFYFSSAGNPKVFLGSTDLMPRNLYRRVESIFPVEDEALRARIIHVLSVYDRDNTKARVMQPDGTYKRINRRGRIPFNAQEVLLEHGTLPDGQNGEGTGS